MNPDALADQINYLAALGRLVVPRAFAFVGRGVLFVGHEPFDAEELGSLLPDGADWHEHQYAPEDFAPDTVVLGRVFADGAVGSALGRIGGSPKVVPQEGFVDEVLFGHDWWGEKRNALRETADGHPGLQAAKNLGALLPVGIGAQPPTGEGTEGKDLVAPAGGTGGADAPPDEAAGEDPAFAWPGTEARESAGSGDEPELRSESALRKTGYHAGAHGPSDAERWRILTEEAVPELGLRQVAATIAWLCRSRRSQRGGRERYARALEDWEHDLERLRKDLYPGHRPRFPWPRSGRP